MVLVLGAVFAGEWIGAHEQGSRALGDAASQTSPIATMAAKQYAGDGLTVAPTPSGARLRSEFQKLNGDATRGGLWVTSTVPGENARLRLIADAIGRDQPAQHLRGSGAVSIEAGVATFTRPGVIELYATSVDGVRQDFIVERRPAGSGQLHVDLALTGAKAKPVSAGATLTLDGSGRELAYTRLHVADANGHTLNASMDVVASDRLSIRVDDANAVYPVRIDPTFSDADWVSLNAAVPGTNNIVNAMVTDASNNLYIGGTFSIVGSALAKYIAKWNGTEWTALGTGPDNTVLALAAIGNDIYAGGDFTLAGGVANTARVAKWNGTSWSALGVGGANQRVAALTVNGNDVYAGGLFTTIGGAAASHVAKWNGSAWSALGSGTTGGQVNALAMLGTDLYMGCNCTVAGGIPINNIARWNISTSAWSTVGAGSTATVTALGVLGGELYAGANGGGFTTTTGSVNGVAKWNPAASQWLAIGAGSGTSSGVESMLVSGGEVFIGGRFTSVNGVPAGGVAKWDGSSWSSLGVGHEPSFPGVVPTVFALAKIGAEVYAGGSFFTMDGKAAHGLARWNGSAWSTWGDGLDNNVNRILLRGTDLYLAGGFVAAPNGVTVNRIAKWNGSTWSGLGTGVNAAVTAIAVDASGNVYVGGPFTKAGSVTVTAVAKWNGASWSALGSGILGGGAINAMAFNSDGDLFVGGSFSTASGPANQNRIVKWNGAAWVALGTGGADNMVNAIATVGADVYVGGTFATMGGITANGVAKWSGGSWSALGTGVNVGGGVNALAVSGTNLYAGGTFTLAGGVAAIRIAKWDGNAWSPMAGGANGAVNAIAVDSQEHVYIGGAMSNAGGPALGIAQWNGSAWLPLGSGVSSIFGAPVAALAVDASGHLFVGGGFTTVGANLVSPFIARADVGGSNRAPVANAGVDQFAAASSASGASITLNGSASSDPDGDSLTYSWTNDFNGTVLSGAAPSITVPFGTHAFTLTTTDGGNLTSTDTVVVTVADSFTISIVTPPLGGATYFRNQVVLGEFACADSANLIASCTSNVVNPDTTTAGTKTFTVTATNSRGDTSSQGRTYQVLAQATQVITFPAPGGPTYGGAATLSATATSGLAPSYTSNTPTVCSVVGSTATALAAGTCSITANQAGDANWLPAAPATQTFVVLTRPVTAMLTASNKVYDGTTAEPNAGLSCVLAGVLPADNGSVICTATAGTFDVVDAGSHTVTSTVAISGAAASNYTLTSSAATATADITKATATIAVAGYAVTFDGATHTAAGVATGVLGEDLSALLRLGSTAHTAAGDYPEDAWTFDGDANYSTATGFTSDSIGKASSTTAIACSSTSTYTGAALELCTATVTGVGSLSAPVAVTYTSNIAVGTATGTATFAGDANHDGSTASATFAITKAALTVTANDKTRAALAPNPAFDGSLTGVLGADAITASYAASAATMPGTYPIVPTLIDPNGRLDNYTVTSVNGTLTVVDADPPVVSVPASLTVEATSADGAVVDYAAQVSAIDAVFGPVSATCAPASGSTFAIGDTTVHCTASDGVGNVGGASFVVTVHDTTAPTLNAVDITVVATNPAGIAVNYAPVGHDLVSGDVASVCSPTSGTVFSIGDHAVSCTATDAAGNVSAIATFTVRVLDGVAPIVTVPAPITSEATGTSGTTVTFAASAIDNVDVTLTATCAPLSGSVFPIGATVVTCTAVDSANNAGTATFTVTVRDTTAPRLSLPVVAPVVSLTPTIVVNYTATATDIVDGAVAVTCTPASGSAFPVGSTPVACTATDAHGNTKTGSFTVKVNDGVAPVVTVSPAGSRTVEATSSAGAIVTYTATATDNYDSGLPVTCAPLSGSVFPIGPATLVTCRATDSAGNIGTTTFTVTVVDTTAPVITVPSPITQAATSASGVAVSFTTSALDLVSGSVPVTCAPASGTTFPVGATTVHCTASDSRGNASARDFTVTVTQSQSGIEKFVVFSRDSTRLLSKATVVSGDIGANERRVQAHGHKIDVDDGDRDDITVRVGQNVEMTQSTSRVVGDTVSLLSKSSVFNIVDNFLINKTGTIRGVVTTPLAIPYLTMPSFPTVAPGTAAITVAKKTTVTLAAGAYGAIKVENGGTLIMTGGLYQVASIDVDQQGTILFRGASTVRVKTEFETGAKANVILDQSVAGLRASQIVFYVLGLDSNCSHSDKDDDGDDNGPAAVHIGQQNVVQANIYAANGTVWIKSKTQATGAFIGMHVRIGQNVTLTLDSAFR